MSKEGMEGGGLKKEGERKNRIKTGGGRE